MVCCGGSCGPACLGRRVQLLGLVPFAGCGKVKIGISTRFFSAKVKPDLGECRVLGSPPLYFSFPFTFSVMEVNRCKWENVSWRKATRLVRFFQEMVTGLVECYDCHFFSLEMGTESTAFPAKLTLFLLKGLGRTRSFVGHLAAVAGCTCHQSLVEMAGS